MNDFAESVNQKIYELIIKEQFEDIYNELKLLDKYVIAKGATLSMLCYNNPTQRGSGDIDVLLPRDSAKQFEQLLHSKGYHSLFSGRKQRIFALLSSHQLIPLVKKLNFSTSKIDINFSVFWGEYEGKLINIDEFLSDAIEINIYGMKVKTLPPLKAMVQLILHHYKDMNSIFLLATRKSIKYSMFNDVFYLLKNNLDTISIDKLYNISVKYNIVPYVFYVLYYTGEIFEDVTLKKYIEAFRTSEGEVLLNRYGLCIKEQKEWKYDFNTRLKTEDLYNLIKSDLTNEDEEKIAINKQIFMGRN